MSDDDFKVTGLDDKTMVRITLYEGKSLLKALRALFFGPNKYRTLTYLHRND